MDMAAEFQRFDQSKLCDKGRALWDQYLQGRLKPMNRRPVELWMERVINNINLGVAKFPAPPEFTDDKHGAHPAHSHTPMPAPTPTPTPTPAPAPAPVPKAPAQQGYHGAPGMQAYPPRELERHTPYPAPHGHGGRRLCGACGMGTPFCPMSGRPHVVVDAAQGNLECLTVAGIPTVDSKDNTGTGGKFVRRLAIGDITEKHLSNMNRSFLK